MECAIQPVQTGPARKLVRPFDPDDKRPRRGGLWVETVARGCRHAGSPGVRHTGSPSIPQRGYCDLGGEQDADVNDSLDVRAERFEQPSPC